MLRVKKQNWDVRFVNIAIKRFENNRSIYRKEGSGQPITIDLTENLIKVETLASSQQDRPGIHESVQKVAQKMSYSKRSVRRQLKKSGYKSLKSLITPEASDGAIQQR